MKRDMDLIRLMLIEIECLPSGTFYETDRSALPNHHDQIAEHLQLLHQAGFVDGFTQQLSGNAHCSGLTWQGHEFLDAARSDTVWLKAKKRLLAAGGSMTVAVMKDLLITEARRQLGLPE